MILPHVSPLGELKLGDRLSPSEAIARANKLVEQLRARTLPPLWERNISKEEWNNLKQ